MPESFVVPKVPKWWKLLSIMQSCFVFSMDLEDSTESTFDYC